VASGRRIVIGLETALFRVIVSGLLVEWALRPVDVDGTSRE